MDRLTQTVIYAAAEQETGNAGETEQPQEFEQKSMEGEMTEAEYLEVLLTSNCKI